MLTVQHFLILSAIIFSIGAIGVLVRKNAIVVFMCIELMLNAVNISFVALSHYKGLLSGQIMVFFIMVVAAAEAAVGLAIILALFRTTESIETDVAGEMRR